MANIPEYHTSADDLNFVSASALADTLGTLLEVIGVLESDVKFRNLSPIGRASAGEEGTSAGSEREGADGAPVDAQSFRRQQQCSRYC